MLIEHIELNYLAVKLATLVDAPMVPLSPVAAVSWKLAFSASTTS